MCVLFALKKLYLSLLTHLFFIAAIELNDAEFMFKGYIRRAEARRKRGKLWEAWQDAEAALKLDSESVLALKLRDECEREYKSVEGDLAKESVIDQPKTRLAIVEVDEQEATSSVSETVLGLSSKSDTVEVVEAPVEIAHQAEQNVSNSLLYVYCVLTVPFKLDFSTIQIEDVDGDDEDDFNFDDLAEEEPCVMEQQVADELVNIVEPPVIIKTHTIDHTIPQSSIELENTWNSLRNNKPAFSKLVISISPDTLYQLAKGVHETDVISDILGSLTETQGIAIFK
jgi:hypothetical protein